MKKNKLKNNSGFTLIETLIYIALFAFIMSSALVSVYTILSGNARNLAKAMVAEEGSFLLGKIDYVLSDVKTVSAPNDGDASTTDYGNTLQILKFDGVSIVKINLDGNNLEIDRGAGYKTLNNSNVEVACPPSPEGCFIHKSASSDGINPESVEVKFTVSSRTSEGLSFEQDFSTIKYLRK